MEAIVLAGGMGTRLRQVVPDLPKPLAPVAGRPFLEHLLDYWIAQGVSRFVLSVGYRHEMIERHFGRSYRDIPIACAVEASPLGTGGGLLSAAAELTGGGPTLVLNGDTYFKVPLPAMARTHAERGAAITLALFPTTDAARYQAVELDRDERVISLTARGHGTLQANGGVYLFQDLRELARQQGGGPCSLERDILPRELAAGKRVFGYQSGGAFIDIGVPEDYARAERVLAA